MVQRKPAYRATDPEGKGRGAGYYWHRGRGVYSKFTDNPYLKQTDKFRIRKNNRNMFEVYDNETNRVICEFKERGKAREYALLSNRTYEKRVNLRKR